MRKAQIKEALLKNLNGYQVCEDLIQNDKEFRVAIGKPHLEKLYNNGNEDRHLSE